MCCFFANVWMRFYDREEIRVRMLIAVVQAHESVAISIEDMLSTISGGNELAAVSAKFRTETRAKLQKAFDALED